MVSVPYSSQYSQIDPNFHNIEKLHGGKKMTNLILCGQKKKKNAEN